MSYNMDLGHECWDHVSVWSCWGRCDSREISDWKVCFVCSVVFLHALPIGRCCPIQVIFFLNNVYPLSVLSLFDWCMDNSSENCAFDSTNDAHTIHSFLTRNRIIPFACMLGVQKLWPCCAIAIRKPIQRLADMNIWKQMLAIVRFVNPIFF